MCVCVCVCVCVFVLCLCYVLIHQSRSSIIFIICKCVCARLIMKLLRNYLKNTHSSPFAHNVLVRFVFFLFFLCFPLCFSFVSQLLLIVRP